MKNHHGFAQGSLEAILWHERVLPEAMFRLCPDD